ncbi:MAG: CPBP family intramembrane glutamic endopeptidase [Fulvivirga sp.]|nr:CPBP family intramembrane glutamic endopeptidase [Fulvivirga sp.]
MKKLSKNGWYYVGLTYLLSIIPYYFIIANAEGSEFGGDWILPLMWMPTLAAIIYRLVKKESLFKNIGWNPLKNFKWVLLAAFLPFAVELLTIALTIALGGAEYNSDYLIINENGLFSINGNALLFGAGDQPWYQLLPNYLLSYFVGTLFYSIVFALGEEYGWRGFLQKKWAPNNELMGFIIIGIVWAYWHFPGILMGHNFPDYPVMGAFVLMPIMTVSFSIVFGLGYSLSKNIWVPVVFHGAINISKEVAGLALVEESINHPINDVVWHGLWIIFALYFVRKYLFMKERKLDKASAFVS